MLKTRLTKGISFAATVAILAGCNVPQTTQPEQGKPSVAASSAAPTTAPTVAPTTAPTVAPTTAPTAVVSANPSVSGSATPAAPTSTTAPDKVTGVTSDIKELATFNGKVYDTSGVPVENATVTAKSVDPAVTSQEAQQTQSGIQPETLQLVLD
ncbi:MAG: hypothetical protein U0457_01005 [Candidatus Sericytochromatia bacterium]